MSGAGGEGGVRGPAAAPRGDDVAEQLREALNFLSHDAREGHASTLALLELRRGSPEGAATSELAQRIERNARRSLTRIDDFVAYARARSQTLQLEEVDLHDLLLDAVAEAWHTGHERGVRLQVTAPPAVPVRADRGMLRAAVARLLQHAVDHGRSGSDLVCTIRELPQAWSIEVDEVPKSPAPAGEQDGAADSARTAPEPAGGRGHGWALVGLVAERLGGAAQAWNENEDGVRLRMTLPRA